MKTLNFKNNHTWYVPYGLIYADIMQSAFSAAFSVMNVLYFEWKFTGVYSEEFIAL